MPAPGGTVPLGATTGPAVADVVEDDGGEDDKVSADAAAALGAGPAKRRNKNARRPSTAPRRAAPTRMAGALPR